MPQDGMPRPARWHWRPRSRAYNRVYGPAWTNLDEVHRRSAHINLFALFADAAALDRESGRKRGIRPRALSIFRSERGWITVALT